MVRIACPTAAPLLLLALLAFISAARADSLAVSTPTFSLTFVDFWRLADPPVRDSATQVLGPYNSSAALFTRSGAPSALEAEILSLVANRLSLGTRTPVRTLDTLETLGAQTFAVSEWKDTSALAADPLLRVRSLVLRRGDLAFAAVLLYRSGGCGSVLFTVRTALSSLVLRDPSSIRRGRADGRVLRRKGWETGPESDEDGSRDALGRSNRGRHGSISWRFRDPAGGPENAYSSRTAPAKLSGQAAPACMEGPP